MFRSREQKYMAAVLLVAVLVSGAVMTRALFLGGGGAPQSSSDINLDRGLVGWWKLDGNANDSTPYSNNGTINGGVTPTTDRNGKTNGAMSFDGSTGYISVPVTAATEPNGSAESVMLWIKGSNTQGSVLANIGGWSRRLFNASWTIVDSGGTYQSISVPGINDNKWHQVGYTFDGTNIRGYVDGQLKTTVASASMKVGTGTWWLGQTCSGSSCGLYFAGSLDDFRVYNRALSAAEVSAYYNSYDSSANIDTGQVGLAGWWKMDGNGRDASPHANNGTLNGTTSTTDRSSQAGRALSFNGSSDSMTVADSPSLRLSPNLTVSLWIKVDSLTNKTGCCAIVMAKESGATNRNYNIYVNRTSGYAVGSSSFGGTQSDLSSNTNINDAKWHLVTYVVAGTAQRIYVDGSLKNSATKAANVDTQTSNLGFSSGGAFQGELDDVRIYNRALSATEISNLYSSYDSQISLYGTAGSSGGSVNLSSGLVGDWAFNGNGRDGTPYSNNMTANGATLTVDRLGRSNSAYSFDGVSNTMTAADSTSLDSGSMTASFWFTLSGTLDCDANNNWRSLIRKGSPSSSTVGWDVVLEQSGSVQFDVGDGTATHRSGSIPVGMTSGTPIFLTFSYDASTGIRNIYANGALKNTATLTAAPISSSSDLFRLANGTNAVSCPNGAGYTPGTYDDVRLWNRALSSTEVAAAYAQYR